MENLAWKQSQCVGRSRGLRPYRRNRASRHSCAPSFVPLTVDGCTVSQAPVFVARCSLRACKTGPPYSAAVRASIGIILKLLEIVCRKFREEIPCKLLGICTLVHVNQNLSDEGSFDVCGPG